MIRETACFLLFVNAINCANILALFPVNEISHFIVYRPFLEKLAERGHYVDVFGHFPREKPLLRYTDISVKGTVPLVKHFDLNFIKKSSLLEHLDYVYKIFGDQLCESVGNSSQAKNLQNSSKKYDLIITEIFFSDCMIGYAKIFNAPVIGLTTSVNLPWASYLSGIPDNPSYIRNYHSKSLMQMNIFDRMKNAISLISAKIWHMNTMIKSNEYYNKIFENKSIGNSMNDVLENISLVFVNSHFSLHGSRPKPVNFIEIGGMHIKENPVLKKNFESHLSTNLNGIIYVSFGTLFKSEFFLQDKIKAIFEVLGKIPYKILWKGDSTLIPKYINVPKNIHFIKWMPQVEVLCHNNITLFISHCGCASVLESMHCGTPILGLPIWGDQFLNANVAVDKGSGLMIPFFDVTKEKFSRALQEILENPKFLQNAKKTSKIFQDRIIPPLDEAVYWTEYVIKHKGAPHLRSMSLSLPWYTHYCIDLILILIASFLLFLFVIYYVLKYLSRFVKYHITIKKKML